MTSPRRRGIPFVIAAPSGTGKTTLCRRVVANDAGIVFSISHTTRTRRAGEVDGSDYHFVTPAAFERMVEAGAFLEWAVYNGHRYGTSWAAVEAPLAAGRDVLLEIEVQGARQVRARRADARLIFLLPPSMAVLEERLRGRGTDSSEEIRRRLVLAGNELAAIGDFDYAIVNDDLDACVASVEAVIRAERDGAPAVLRGRFSVDVALARFRAAGAPG